MTYIPVAAAASRINGITAGQLRARFEAKIPAERTEDGCWEWQGTLTQRGYGQLWLNRGTVAAHRLSWAVAHGEWPAELFVCHHCDNPRCVNPAHLFLGTAADNAHDAMRKGRFTHAHKPWLAARASFARQTHCRNGHEFTPENTEYSKAGHRRCYQCGIISKRLQFGWSVERIAATPINRRSLQRKHGALIGAEYYVSSDSVEKLRDRAARFGGTALAVTRP